MKNATEKLIRETSTFSKMRVAHRNLLFLFVNFLATFRANGGAM